MYVPQICPIKTKRKKRVGKEESPIFTNELNWRQANRGSGTVFDTSKVHRIDKRNNSEIEKIPNLLLITQFVISSF